MGARLKGPRDVVTAADLASERHVLRRLTELFPGDGVVAEEGGRVPAGGGRAWYVDPLDGTMNFSRGIPVWAVSLALFEDGRPALGVVHDPIRQEAFTALAGSGAWCNEEPITCSDVTELSSAVVHVTIDFNDASMLEGVDDIKLVAPRVLRTCNLGSAALALAYVAAGRFDAMLHRFAHAWDYGAGVVLVQEAGGSVTDLRGAPYTSDTFALAAGSTLRLQGSLLDLLRPRSER
jgi:myo-inositol-1(or 4)-monophosphatase